MSSTERKMAAIVAMDVTSYSEKMGRDEEGTLKHLRACREIIETVVAENRGRIFNTAGDAFMIEFSSAVSALSAAVEIQKLIKNRNESLEKLERMHFRMGVNVGDIIIEGDNLYGEGVNIAARLEGIAAPGGISISEKVYAEVRKKFNFVFEDKGHQELKNIDDPVRVYELNTDAVSTSGGISSTSRKNTSAQNSRNMIIVGLSVLVVAIAGYFFVAQKGLLKSSDPAKLANTILFLPVETLSEEKLAKNFAFGLTQDLHSSLSRATGLNIIKVPKKPDDLIALTKQSEAQYVIDSSLMQSGDNFRLTVNLMNTTTMASIWSKTYDKKMSASDIFSTQDEIVKSLVQELSVGGFINAAMMKDIGNRSIAKGTDNSSAYECVNFYKAVYLSTFSQENGTKALKCLKESTKKDPNYADAWSSLGQLQGLMYSWGQLDAVVLDEALPNIERAIALEPNNAMYYVTKASTLNMQKKWEPMFAALDKALEISPNNAEVVANVVVTYITGGDCTEAQRADFNAPKGTYTKGLCQWQKGFEAGLKADELDKSGSMFPPRNFPMANVYIRGGQWKNAAARLEKVNFPGFFWYELFSGLAMHGDGNKEQATKHFEALKKSLGSSNLSEIGKQMTFWNMKGAFESWTPIFIGYGFN
jgi:class 3 adenylate cyclase/TolB-like protein